MLAKSPSCRNKDMAMTLFHMWNPHRQYLIEGHKFYVEQAQKRLLSQFENIEEEANQFSKEWLENAGQSFDPDRHDPSAFHEQSVEEGIAFYQLLDDMRRRTRLSIIAGLYHEWEKQLRSWIVKEVRHWAGGNVVKQALLRASFADIADLFGGLGWSIKTRDYYESLARCGLVVNVYKHGDGESFEKIRASYPEFISHFEGDPSGVRYSDYSDLEVTEKHFREFSDAVISFWEDVPEFISGEGEANVPNWFEKAFKKDAGASKG